MPQNFDFGGIPAFSKPVTLVLDVLPAIAGILAPIIAPKYKYKNWLMLIGIAGTGVLLYKDRNYVFSSWTPESIGQMPPQLLTGGSVRGALRDDDGEIIDATIELLDVNGRTIAQTDTEGGAFSFTGLAPGEYVLQANDTRRPITIRRNQPTRVFVTV